jgi:hypothetical protein
VGFEQARRLQDPKLECFDQHFNAVRSLGSADKQADCYSVKYSSYKQIALSV